MATQYLLPCQCGQDVTVRPHQAGGTVHCQCGNELSVPSMREIRALPTAEQEAAPKDSGWSRKKGIVLLLGAVALAGGVLGAALWVFAPEVSSVDREAMRSHVHDYVQRLTPAESYYEWIVNIREPGLTDEQSLSEAYVHYRRATLHRLAFISWGVGAVAALLAVLIAVAVPGGSREPAGPSKRA